MSTSNFKWYRIFFVREHRKYLYLILMFLIIASILGVKTPVLVKNLSDHFKDSDEVFFQSLYFLGINFFLIYLNRVCFQLSVTKYVSDVIHYARLNVFGRWLCAKEKDADRYPQGEIISRVMNDTEAVRELITSGSFGLFIDLAFVISCLIGFIQLHLFLGMSLSAFEIVAILLLIWGSTLMREFFVRLRSTQALVNRTTSNVVGGLQDLYFTENNHFAKKKTASAFDQFLKTQNQVNAADALYYAVAESLYPIILVFMALILPFTEVLLASLLLALVDLIQRSINPIKEISGKIANLQRAHTGLERIEQFLSDLAPNQVEKIHIEDEFKKLEINISSFKYPTGNAEKNTSSFELKDIFLEGKSSELIGLVGLSGSGKTTVMNIVCGVLEIQAGEMKIHSEKGELVVTKNVQDKKAIENWQHFKNQVSLVSQDSHIFSEELYFNITLGLSNRDEFKKAWDFYCSQIPYLMEWGLTPESKIEPSKLSLGQRQLLAGLRACFLRKNIVLFDEISSAMDSHLEMALRSLILLLQKSSLTIIVAHRIETLIHSDHIYVMDKGGVVGSGKHKELLAKNEIYKEFIKELSLS